MHPALEVSDLKRALALFGDRYHSLAVFADDLSPNAQAELAQVPAVETEFGTFRLDVADAEGVVRFSRDSTSALVAAGASAGALFGAAIAAAGKARGEGIVGGVVLGLLVGGALTALATDPGPRRVFSLAFDPQTRQWTAYDGQLLRWMKDRMLSRPHPSAVAAAS